MTEIQEAREFVDDYLLKRLCLWYEQLAAVAEKRHKRAVTLKDVVLFGFLLGAKVKTREHLHKVRGITAAEASGYLLLFPEFCDALIVYETNVQQKVPDWLKAGETPKAGHLTGAFGEYLARKKAEGGEAGGGDAEAAQKEQPEEESGSAAAAVRREKGKARAVPRKPDLQE